MVARLAAWMVALAAASGCATPRPTARAPASPPAPPPPRASVRVEPAGCLAAHEVEASVTQVLIEHRAMDSGLVVAVAATGGTERAPADGTEVELRVVRPTGEVGLERRYPLGAADCASAPQLLALGIDRWLTSFPEWADPPPQAPLPPALPPALPPPPAARWIDVLLTSAINGVGFAENHTSALPSSCSASPRSPPAAPRPTSASTRGRSSARPTTSAPPRSRAA